MADDRQQQQKEAARTQTESRAASAAHEAGIKSQVHNVLERKHNPQFYEKFTRTDLEESERWGHLAEEYRPWLADDHLLANRRQIHRQQREILNKTRSEQAVTGRNPGTRLREKPLLNALAQGVNPELDKPMRLTAAGQSRIDIRDPSYSMPMDAEERSAMDDVAEIATSRQSMGVDKAGSEALTTATTENRTVREEGTEKSGITGRISGAFD